MRKSLNVFRYIPKKMVAVAALFLAVVNTFAVIAAPAVKLESNLSVANYTAGDSQYSKEVNATYDQVVKFKVYYHNTEDPTSNKVAENVSIKIDMPKSAGTKQTVTSSIKGDNTNVVVDTASVNLNRPDAYLEFIPGSVDWKHNAGSREAIKYETVNISDSVVTSGAYVKIEHQKPCFEYEAWITFFARVKVPSVDIQKTVSVDNSPWGENATAKPGSTVKYLLTLTNAGNSVAKNVGVKDILPAGVTLQPGTTKVFTSTHPDGVIVSDNIVSANGINVGDIAVGGNIHVGFRATIASADKLKCGENKLVNKAQTVSDGFNGDEDTATVTVDRKCDTTTPTYSCEALATLVNKDKREVKANLTADHSAGVTVKSYKIDFGDGTVVDEQSATHTYTKDGSYSIKGSVTFSVGLESKTVDCTDVVDFTSEKPTTPVTPTTLPNTGAGSMITAIFGAGSVTAAFRSYIESRRALKGLVG